MIDERSAVDRPQTTPVATSGGDDGALQQTTTSGWGQSHSERVNRRWIAGSFTVGALFIVAAIVSAFVTGDTHPGISIVFETMDSVGVAFLLAGVLFILQRHFVIQVQEVATRTAVAAADARIDERVGHVDARIDELGERMNKLLAERDLRQAEVVRAMDVPTFQTVANALTEANQLDALANGQITVQGSRDIDELGLTFSWGVYLSDGLREQNPRAALTVTAHVYADDNASGGRPVIETSWDPDEPAEHVGLRLRQQLESRGRWRGDNTLDWPIALKNLKRSIDLAIRSRKRDPAGWTLKGALFELVGVDWAITEAGIECRGHGVVLPAAEFPERDFRARKPPPSSDNDDLWQPAAPDWVDPSLWDELVRRGRSRFPIWTGPRLGPLTWMPLNHTPPTDTS